MFLGAFVLTTLFQAHLLCSNGILGSWARLFLLLEGHFP